MKLHAAFVVPLLLSVPVLAWAADAAPPAVVPINQVQGTGPQSPMLGQQVTVEGVAVVAGDPQATPVGLYLQSLRPDEAGKASNAIYVVLPPAMMAPKSTDVLRVTGTVAELGNGQDTMTSLVRTQVETIGQRRIAWAWSDAGRLDELGLERYEGEARVWRVVVSDAERFADRGEIRVALGQRLFTPTEVAAPGVAAQSVARHNAVRDLTLDDLPEGQPSALRWNYLPSPISSRFPLRAGTGLTVHGVIDQRSARYRLVPTGQAGEWHHGPDNTRPSAPDVKGNVRIASLNVLNLFNGDGRQGAFPTPRGAETFAAYQLQQKKIVASVQALKPDVAALMEVENDGTGPDSALAQFVAALNAAGPIKDYRFVDSGKGPGTNPIRVALIYRDTRVAAVGKFATLDGGPFTRHSRVPLAQAFRRLAKGKATGKPFVVVANHFKSKGCGKGEDAAKGADADQKDGQSCWNATRVESARRVDAWLRTDPTGTQADRNLLVGDFNAYAMEDPITTLLAAGWQDALALAKVPAPYSFVYDGLSGRLDHALLSPALAGALRGAAEWHNNADESERFAYNGSDPDPGPYRASDHDPILLGFELD